MNLIKDVSAEISGLDTSVKSLKNFGLLVGAVFIAVGSYFTWQQFPPIIYILLFLSGLLLIGFALISPLRLHPVYKIWMGLAFTLGWFMSRFILTILFYLVLTPVGLLAKLAGKKFLNTKYKTDTDSYWIKKDDISNLEKMY